MKLRELCEAIIDCEHKTAPTIDESEYSVIRTPDIGKGRLIVEQARKVSANTFEVWTRRATPRPGDLIFAREAPVGNVAIVLEGQKVCLGQRTVLLRPDRAKVSPEYLCYYILSEETQARLLSKASGATLPHLNVADIRALDVPSLPPLDAQVRISAVLSAYDDLIAANQRRIQLLEESARLLYREWFVKLRFPGHETVPVTDGMPEGWAKMPLEELAEVVMGQSPESKFFNEDGEGLPFHQGVTNFGERYVTHSIFSTHATRIAQTGDILCSVRAPVGRLNITLDKIVIGRGLSAMRSKKGTQSLLFYQLKNLFFQENLIGGGAIFASVGKKELFGQELLQPSETTAFAFEKFSSGVDQQIEAITLQMRRLQEARDLLLPKLMSGALDVSGIAAPKEAAA